MVSQELNRLDATIKNLQYFIITVLIVIIGFYTFHFWVILDYPLTKDPKDLGAFGDYIGGILNPFVALGAFTLLSISIRIQQKELSETKEALKNSSKSQEHAAVAQQKQARLMWRTTQLTAINTQMQSIMSDIELARNDIQYMNDQIPNKATINTFNGEKISNSRAKERVNEIKIIVENLVEQKNLLNSDISFLRSINDERVEEAQQSEH